MSILVLGATGLLGNAVFRVLSESANEPVFGTIRNAEARKFFTRDLGQQLEIVDDLRNENQLLTLFDKIRPTFVVNCTALGKDEWQDPLKMLSIYSVLPQKLAHICRLQQARLVQISTDCVFNGTSGNRTEDDLPNPDDSYGVAKLLGEVKGPGTITLRTSIIGHELNSKKHLLEWFLSQNGDCMGYTKAIFSGFPTIVLAHIIRDVILPRPELEGIYHLASTPISKFDLLQLIAQKYGRSIKVSPNDELAMDRSLSPNRFVQATGYRAPGWPELIDSMYSYKFGLEEK